MDNKPLYYKDMTHRNSVIMVAKQSNSSSKIPQLVQRTCYCREYFRIYRCSSPVKNFENVATKMFLVSSISTFFSARCYVEPYVCACVCSVLWSR